MTCLSSWVESFRTRTFRSSKLSACLKCFSQACPQKTSSTTCGGTLAVADTQANRQAMLELIAELQNKHNAVRQGGGEESLRLHTSRGKMFVRDRIKTLIDAG